MPNSRDDSNDKSRAPVNRAQCDAHVRTRAGLPRRRARASSHVFSRSTQNGLRDLRGLAWSSIDNDDSRDLDQIEVCSADANSAVTVLVAIADVDGLVPRESPLDAHAATNTTSVYTPALIFPMLPPELSTDRTSLNEGEDRSAIVTTDDD